MIDTAHKNLKKGQSLVEFALTLPILLLIIFMIFDLGRAVFYFSAINHGAHEGVRFGSVRYSVANENIIINRVREASIGIGDAIVFDENSPCVCFDSIDRAHLNISISYVFVPVTPFVGEFLEDGKIKLNTDSNMIIEYYMNKYDVDKYTACSPKVCEDLW